MTRRVSTGAVKTIDLSAAGRIAVWRIAPDNVRHELKLPRTEWIIHFLAEIAALDRAGSRSGLSERWDARIGTEHARRITLLAKRIGCFIEAKLIGGVGGEERKLVIAEAVADAAIADFRAAARRRIAPAQVGRADVIIEIRVSVERQRLRVALALEIDRFVVLRLIVILVLEPFFEERRIAFITRARPCTCQSPGKKC